MNNSVLIGPFSQLLTMADLPSKGSIDDEQLNIISDGGILVKDGYIVSVGTFADLKSTYVDKVKVLHIDNDSVGLPGFIDAHTHICFAGSRANDYSARNSGKSYLEIAASGGGIWSTVKQTRAADKETLVEGIISRSERHLRTGVTTIEVKSGYGLNVIDEMKMLRAINEAEARTKADLVSTCLAAHTIPKDFPGSEQEYLSYILHELIPTIVNNKLSSRVDIFIEKGSFTPLHAKDYLLKCKQLGFDITIHADQFSTGGSKVAIDVGALSADHLEASSAKEIHLLSKSETIPVALPGASLGLGCGFTPARKLLDAGASLAIASDWNPGSAPMGNLLMQAAVLGTFEKLSNAEVFSGLTFRSAIALGLKDRGILGKGKRADFISFPTSDYREILYQQGMMMPNRIWKNGELVFAKDKD